MSYSIHVAPYIYNLVKELQDSGFETYIVGGAIRDHLLGRDPKDYDISTSATPEEVRMVFGRGRARIIGKRFRLVHVRAGATIVEVSTFRAIPKEKTNNNGGNDPFDEPNIIRNDNCYGCAREDAFRRDFTVNALFYDPVKHEMIDHTGYGIADVKNHIVRAIGEPFVRFEEDPVRILRALKLVGQYGFTIEEKTLEALGRALPLIKHASISRLSLELEKILTGSYGEKIICAFREYGFLASFLPYLDERWGSTECDYALELLAERNARVKGNVYRNSITIALSCLALPFVEKELGGGKGESWLQLPREEESAAIEALVRALVSPQQMMNRVIYSTERTLRSQRALRFAEGKMNLVHSASYPHARELLFIQNAVLWHEDDFEQRYPYYSERRSKRNEKNDRNDRTAGPEKKRRRKRGGRGRSRRPDKEPQINDGE